MKHLASVLHVAGSLLAGILLGTWLFMLCFGPFGFLFLFSERLRPTTLARLDALPGKPLAFGMLVLGLVLAWLVWRRAPQWRWLLVTAALATGIPCVIWILLVTMVSGAVPNFGYGG
jgi:hypothetical protein